MWYPWAARTPLKRGVILEEAWLPSDSVSFLCAVGNVLALHWCIMPTPSFMATKWHSVSNQNVAIKGLNHLSQFTFGHVNCILVKLAFLRKLFEYHVMHMGFVSTPCDSLSVTSEKTGIFLFSFKACMSCGRDIISHFLDIWSPILFRVTPCKAMHRGPVYRKTSRISRE